MAWKPRLLLPGHSPGSLGVVTADGDAFVGDLFVNYTMPSQPIYLSDRGGLAAELRAGQGTQAAHGLRRPWRSLPRRKTGPHLSCSLPVPLVGALPLHHEALRHSNPINEETTMPEGLKSDAHHVCAPVCG